MFMYAPRIKVNFVLYKKRSDFAAAWMNLGIVLSRKNTTEAMDCYFKALKHRKRYPDCEYNLGNLVS